MMKLSKMPFLALISLFLLANILITTSIIKLGPAQELDKPFQKVIDGIWAEKSESKQDSILKSLYPEINKDFPQLVQSHKFYTKNKSKNSIDGRSAFSELTLRMFSFYQYVKRKNWQTLTRVSFQGLQHYGSELDRYATGEDFNAKKVMRYNNEMKELTVASKISSSDKEIILAKLNTLNEDLNRVEIYVGEKDSLRSIKNEINAGLSKLANYSKEPTPLSFLDNVSKITFDTFQWLIVQYLLSGFIFYTLLSLYRSKRDLKFEAQFEKNPEPLALLNKKGQFTQINEAFKKTLPFTKFNLIRNIDWARFEKLARVEMKSPISTIKETYVTSGSLTKDECENNFLIRLTPINAQEGYCLSLIPKAQVEAYQEIVDLPVFTPPEAREEVHLSYILEDVLTDLSNLFQSKQVELSLSLKGERHLLTGNVQKTHVALKSFIRDMILALAPKSKSKIFNLTLEETLDGITLRADMQDVKLATPILKSNFKFEEQGKTKKRNLNQGIEVLKNSGLGFDVDLNFKNNFDIENKFTGSNISIEMRQ